MKLNKREIVNILRSGAEECEGVTNGLSSLLCVDVLLNDVEISVMRADLLSLKQEIFSWYEKAEKELVDDFLKEQVALGKSFIQEQIAAVLRNLKLNAEFNCQRADVWSLRRVKSPIIVLDTHNIPPSFDLLRQGMSNTRLGSRRTVFVEQFIGDPLRIIDLEDELDKAHSLPDEIQEEYKFLSLPMDVFNRRQEAVAEALLRRPDEFIARTLTHSDDRTFEVDPGRISVATEESFVDLKYVFPTLVQAKKEGNEVKPADVCVSYERGFRERAMSNNFLRIRNLGFALHLALEPNSIMVVGASHGVGIVSLLKDIFPRSMEPICVFPTYTSLGPQDPIIAHKNFNFSKEVLSSIKLPKGCLVLDMSLAGAESSVGIFTKILQTGRLPSVPCDLQMVPGPSSELSINSGSYNLVRVQVDSTFRGDVSSSEEISTITFGMPGALPSIDRALIQALNSLKTVSKFMGTPVKVGLLLRMQKSSGDSVASMNFCLSFDSVTRQIVSGDYVPTVRRMPRLLLEDSNQQSDTNTIRLRSRL